MFDQDLLPAFPFLKTQTQTFCRKCANACSGHRLQTLSLMMAGTCRLIPNQWPEQTCRVQLWHQSPPTSLSLTCVVMHRAGLHREGFWRLPIRCRGAGEIGMMAFAQSRAPDPREGCSSDGKSVIDAVRPRDMAVLEVEWIRRPVALRPTSAQSTPTSIRSLGITAESTFRLRAMAYQNASRHPS